MAGWLTNSCMLGGRFCTKSACVPGASEDVRVCCWLSLGEQLAQNRYITVVAGWLEAESTAFPYKSDVLIIGIPCSNCSGNFGTCYLRCASSDY